jgi:hypothetical protein
VSHEGELFTCTRCRTPVRLWANYTVDPDLFVGHVCRDRHDEIADWDEEPPPRQLTLVAELDEVRDHYDPADAVIPF